MFKIILSMPLIFSQISDSKDVKIQEEIQGFSFVNTATLKKWYDEGREMIILDARKDGWFDHQLLPRAIRLPHNSSEEVILQILPKDKNVLIVAYCGGADCPASRYLCQKLLALGYTRLYEYVEGIPGWIEAGYETINDE